MAGYIEDSTRRLNLFENPVKLGKSHKLVMCVSPAYIESDWGKMEHYTLLLRDLTNLHRRLIQLLIAYCILPDIVAHFSYIDWRTFSDEEYDKLLAFCLKKKLGSPSINLDAGVQTFNPGYYQDSKQGTLVLYFSNLQNSQLSNWQDFESLCCDL